MEQAVGSSCSTTSIKPLLQQIIDEMQCMDPDGLAEVPAKNKVDTGVLDMSYRASDFLFNESVGFADDKSVHGVEVAADTPLGPSN